MQSDQVCPRCGESLELVFDICSYIVLVCRDCSIASVPPIAPFQEYDDLEEWAVQVQCVKPPISFE